VSAAAAALVAQATTQLRAGDAEAAVASIESAPAATRNTAAVQRLLAAACAQLGDLAAAQAAITRALAQPPVEPATRALAGRIALDRKQPEQAFPHFEALVQLAPQQAAFWRYLWDAATTTQTARRALQLMQVAKLDASADVHVAWAASRALADDGNVAAALALAEQTALRHPDSGAAQWLWIKRLTDETPLTALAGAERVPSATPAALFATAALDADRIDAAITVPEQYASEDAVTAWRERCAAGWQRISAARPQATLDAAAREGLLRNTAFRLAYHGRDDLPLQRLRGDFLSTLLQPLTPRRAPAPGADGRLRVAFVSRHVRDCTVGQYFRRFMTDLGDARIAVQVFACGRSDAFTDEVEARVERLHRFDDEAAAGEVAQAIAAAAPDVLIYLEIGMEPLIEKLAAQRLAPLQCTLWGHPVTTGLPTIDVFFSAAALEPEDAAAHYRERLQLLPGLGTCYPLPPSPSTLDRVPLGLPADGPLLVCAQSPFKWSPAFAQAVAAILARAPGQRLVVFDSPVASRSRVFDGFLRHFLAPLGVDPVARVVRLPQRSRADFLAVLTHCDLALDSFGFSGGNTSLDALSVGLPVLTLPGEFMRGRQTLAMLRTLGGDCADALVATTAADYVERALRIASDAGLRAALHAGIVANARQLFDDPAPVAALRDYLLASRTHGDA